MRRGERGVVYVETALVVGTILTMLLFSLQLGTLGFLQMTADAASFVDARLTAVGVDPTASTTPATVTSKIFPQIAPSQIASTVAPAPSPSVPVDYGYNSTDPTEYNQSITHRDGGVSMIEPTLATSTVTKSTLISLLGKAIGIKSQSIDALWLECGIHANVSNSAAGCGPAAMTTFQGNYFSAGEDAPPYFIGFDYLHHCTDAQPWQTCSTPGGNFLALGTGEYLHGAAGAQDGNWDNTNAGIGGYSGTSTFSNAACHQRIYAAIATKLAAYPSLQTYYNTTNPNLFLGQYIPNAEAIYYQVYAYGAAAAWPNPGTGGSTTGYNDFSTGPYPLFGYNTIFDFDAPTNQLIQQVYEWDSTVVAGTEPGAALAVGSYPTYPAKNCQ